MSRNIIDRASNTAIECVLRAMQKSLSGMQQRQTKISKRKDSEMWYYVQGHIDSMSSQITQLEKWLK